MLTCCVHNVRKYAAKIIAFTKLNNVESAHSCLYLYINKLNYKYVAYLHQRQ